MSANSISPTKAANVAAKSSAAHSAQAKTAEKSTSANAESKKKPNPRHITSASAMQEKQRYRNLQKRVVRPVHKDSQDGCR